MTGGGDYRPHHITNKQINYKIMNYLSSDTKVSNSQAFCFIRDLIEEAQADKFETRIVCEYKDILGDLCYNGKQSEGYLLIDFSEDNGLMESGVWDRWPFKDNTLVCYITSCFKHVSKCIDIHNKQVLITYLYRLWKNGRMARLYAEGY